MSFRNIRPSFGESSASASNPSQSTSESTGSDPRGHSRPGEKDTTESSSTASKRRRVPEQVTKNACTNCKKARAKCDGKKPCGRCKARLEPSDCVYETHIKHAKEELVNQIKELQAQDLITKQVLRALTLDDQAPDILQRLKAGEALESIVEGLGRAAVDEDDMLSPKGSQHSGFETSDQEMMENPSAFRWTTVVADSAVLDHLFQLYFAWVHPVHTLFSEGHFVESYQRQSSQFCSPVLVNAMCALACHLHTTVSTDEVDFEQLEVAFSDAARASIDPMDKSVTMIQAFAVLFLVDCARGTSLRASSYLKVAIDNLPSVTVVASEGFDEVLRNTRRGVRCLNVEWANMTFQPTAPISHDPIENFQEHDEKLDEAQWYFYRYVNDQCPAWPGLLATTNREKAKLIAIMTDAANVMYGQRTRSIQARTILQLYQRYKNWWESLPNSIGNTEDNESQVLPHVLSLLILYATAVTQLLRPLLDLSGFPTDFVEEVFWTEAQQGLFLLDQHYRTQYTCRYQPVLQMFGVLHLCDAIARFFPDRLDGDTLSKGGRQAIKFGLEVLMQSRAGFPIAGPFQELLRRTAVGCSVRLPSNINDLVAMRGSKQANYRLDDFIDACTRPSYVQPVLEIQRMFDGDFSDDWVSESPALGFRKPEHGRRRLRVLHWEEERGAQNLMEIRNLLNNS